MADATLQQSSVRNALLAALAPEDWAQLAPHLESVELVLDQTIYAASGPVDAVLFIESGMASLLVMLEGGDQVETGLAGPEGMVGLPLIHGVSHAFTEARVQLEGRALRMGAAHFAAAMERSPGLRAVLLRYAFAFHAMVAQSTACNARHAIEQRLARWLLMAHDRAQSDAFSMTHEFLSLMLGVRRPGVTVAAGMLQKAGLIQYARGRMIITDRPSLEAASCECYHCVRHEFGRLLGRKPGKLPTPPPDARSCPAALLNSRCRPFVGSGRLPPAAMPGDATRP